LNSIVIAIVEIFWLELDMLQTLSNNKITGIEEVLTSFWR